MTPNQFLSIAEQGGFIEEIGKYMLAKVCAQHQAWLAQGIDLGWVAVNISANHFRSREFPGLIRNILHTYGLPASILRIEITEEAMLAPTHDVLHNLEELKKMGVLLAIDDFGTAYSSLEYLVRYPVETLKIDRTFIDQVDINARAQGLVRSIVGMGRNLAMCVVAEGVERKNQLHILRTMQCNEAQGFLFSRPLPPDDYVQVADHLAEQLENSKMVL
ncbi:MAG: EAL domain-containing protein [Firmicutes bacterium]|nr:EAL domain-containing protein [Bacillota bacterium]